MPTTPADETIDADERDAHAPHQADRPPTVEEEQLADKNDLPEHTAEAYQHMSELGAKVKGEGQVDPST